MKSLVKVGTNSARKKVRRTQVGVVAGVPWLALGRSKQSGSQGRDSPRLDRRMSKLTPSPSLGSKIRGWLKKHIQYDCLFLLRDATQAGMQQLRQLLYPIAEAFRKEVAPKKRRPYVHDHLGSIRKVLDNTGVVKDAITYDAWGNILTETDANERGRYGEYVASEERKVVDEHRLYSLRERLEALGRLSHSWQDFFGHAVRIDMKGATHINEKGTRKGETGSENSNWPGFNAFSAGMSADPDSRGGFMPSSYAFPLKSHPLNLTFFAEHPRVYEPIAEKSAEFTARVNAMNTFFNSRFNSLLDTVYRTTCSFQDRPDQRPPPPPGPGPVIKAG